MGKGTLVLFSILIPFFVFTGCSSPKLAQGDEAYSKGEYFEAQKIYRKAYESFKNRDQRKIKGETAFKLGLCYDKLGMSSRAVGAFRNALRYDYADSIAYFYLGKALQGEGKYAEAVKAFSDFLKFKPGDEEALEGIRGCNSALVTKEKSRYKVTNMKVFNSTRSDYAPMYYPDGFDRLYFTSSREKSLGDNKSEVTGQKRGDIYVSRKNERGVWQLPEPAEGTVNSDADEGVITFSADGQTMYLSRSMPSSTENTTVEIFTSKRSDASWNEPVKLEIFGDSLFSAGHPAISPDGRFLYFVSDMPGGFGGTDIWRIHLNGEKPMAINMGSQINTPGNEMFPYLRNDSVFYFSSDGHPGFGGLDIFQARINSTGDFWSVENMGEPINSPADDFGITFGEGESGFFSSNRNDLRGYDNIYSFELPDLNVVISGDVYDRDGEAISGAIIRIVGNDGSNQKEISRDDGTFQFRISPGVKYVMKAGADGYLNKRQEFESDVTEEDSQYAVNFILSSLNKPQVIENIFYDFDKATLRPESKESLDEIIAMLEENPNVSIEFGSHTDRKGSEEYNINLSERRAKSVVDYLISAGIESDRLSYKGYGKSVPKTVTKRINQTYPQFEVGTVLDEEFILTLSPEDQETADQINRRTEFRILSIDYNLF